MLPQRLRSLPKAKQGSKNPIPKNKEKIVRGWGQVASIIGAALRRITELCALVGALALALPSYGQEPEVRKTSSDAPVGELGAIRLRDGLSIRSGGQTDNGPGISYSGQTPNDVSLSGWYFGSGHFGGALAL